MIVRDFAPADAAAARELLESAFPTRAEADLVDQLRAAGEAAIELVGEDAGAILGYILFSPVEAPFRALALAPVAAAPHWQGQGIGSALIRAGHKRASDAGWDGIFVLGDPAYYTRFGYSVEAARGFDSPYSGEHFMLLELVDGLPQSGTVRHAPAFSGL